MLTVSLLEVVIVLLDFCLINCVLSILKWFLGEFDKAYLESD